jgi:MFS family permease
MIHSLFNRNFSMLIFGQISSVFGNIILRFALSMYILEVTGSATIFASLLTISTIPTILLSPFGGILADRANRRNIMVALDFISGLSVLVFFICLSDSNVVPAIGTILIILSILAAFETPNVQACVPQMQEGDNIIRANAVINQVAAVAGFVGPILGSIFYSMFSLYPILITSTVCFFLTALFECFIKLNYIPSNTNKGIISTIISDFSDSMRFVVEEQSCILKFLLLVAVINFFTAGTALVGLPFMIRNILGLNATFYGVAEGILGAAAIAGSLAAGLLVTKLKLQKLYLFLAVLGISFLPPGLAFLFKASVVISYIVIIVSFALAQFIACIFSVFTISAIQQKTPNELLGKVMAYVVTISMCALPFGQMIYGTLFDRFIRQSFLILIPTAIVLFLIGILSKKTFSSLEM